MWHLQNGAGIAQSVLRLASGWTVGQSNSGEGEGFRTRTDWSWSLPPCYKMGTSSVPGCGVNHPSHLEPNLKKE